MLILRELATSCDSDVRCQSQCITDGPSAMHRTGTVPLCHRKTWHTCLYVTFNMWTSWFLVWAHAFRSCAATVLQGKAGWLRNITISLLNITSATGLAIASTSGQGGTNSATVLTIIGATGVLSVSYIIPIVNHFMLLSGR